MRHFLPWIVLIILTIPSVSFTETIYVPTDYPTIQEAIDASVNGDMVLVEPGSYVEGTINYNGKLITVKSISGPESTFIEGGEIYKVKPTIRFNSGETNLSVLDGFTITHYGSRDGKGIRCINSSPSIVNNIIRDNLDFTLDVGKGAGISLEDSSAYVENNLIENNEIWTGSTDRSYGAGICCLGTGSPVIINNIIRGNYLKNYEYSGLGCMGAGIYCDDDMTAVIMNNLIEENINELDMYSGGNATYGGGVCFDGDAEVLFINNIVRNNEIITDDNLCSVTGGGLCSFNENVIITNNTIYGNKAICTGGNATGGGISCPYWITMNISNSIIWNNFAVTEGDQVYGNWIIDHSCIQDGWPGTGNIDLDPLFRDPDNGDFHLPFNSPCRNAGDNNIIRSIDFDYEGDPRVAWGDIVDMGADEFYTHLYCTTGDFYPGRPIEGKLVGIPGKTPTALFIGFDIRDPAAHTAYGDFYIQPPWLLVPLIPIPANGILTLPATVPSSSTPPYDVFVQGLVGLDSDSLTNLCVLEIRMFEE